MKRNKIGETSLDVTEISFGCSGIANLYRKVTSKDCEATFSAAWDAGIRYFDTAPYYGHGLSERRTGDFLRSKPRESYVLSTKVGKLLLPVTGQEIPDYGFIDPLPFAATYDYSHDGILRSVEASLHRLGLARIDILYVHDIGVQTHGAEANSRHMSALLGGGTRALQRLKSEGTISAFGLGVNEVQACLEVMDHTRLDCILLAGRYTMLDRDAEAHLLQRCRAENTSLVIGGVFNSGILATGSVPGAHFDYGPASADILARVAGMQLVTDDHNLPLAAAALQFPLREPSVASVLIGTGKPASLTRNLDLLKMEVPQTVWSKLEAFVIGRDHTNP